MYEGVLLGIGVYAGCGGVNDFNCKLTRCYRYFDCLTVHIIHEHNCREQIIIMCNNSRMLMIRLKKIISTYYCLLHNYLVCACQGYDD